MADDTPHDSAGDRLDSETGCGLPANVAAALSCAFPLIGGIAFLILEKKNAFVRFYAMQSLLFGIAALAISLALELTAQLFHHVPLLGSIMLIFILLMQFAFGLAWLAVWLLTVAQAFMGREWEVPYLGVIARKRLERPAA